MRMSIRHLTRYRYEPEATQAALRLKLFPPATASQTPHDWRVTVNGRAVEPVVTDAHGDRLALWHAHSPVDEIEVLAEGRIDTWDTAGVLKELPQRARAGVFLRSTELTKPSAAIRKLGTACPDGDVLSRLHALSEAVHEAVEYRPAVSDMKTTAAEALAIGAGVCQDQAHVFIAAARSVDIPARYVVGYLHDPDRDRPAEETHAWAEAYVPGLGWTGFDITNQLCPTDLYVRLCCGLDASDAAPVRGTVMGGSEEKLEVEIAVQGASGQSQQQQQS